MKHARRFYQQTWFQLTVGIAVTIACLAWAFYSLVRKDDPWEVLRNIGHAFREADYRSLPILVLVTLVFYWLKSWRWSLLLRPVGSFTTRQTFPPMLIGFAFNNLLPAHLGEFVRVYVFSRKHQLNQAAVLSSVVLERIFDILAILAFFFLGLAFTEGLPQSTRQLAWGFAVFVGVGIVCAVVYLVWTKPFVALVEAILARLPFIPLALRTKVCWLLEGGAAGLAALKSSWLVAAIALNSLTQWGLNGILMHISLWSFGIEVSPLTSCLLLGVVAFAVTIPASPGYFGVIQAAFVLVINERTVGVTNEAAVFAASIYFHITQYLLVTSVGLVLFNLTGLSMSQVRHEAEEAEDAADNSLPDAPLSAACANAAK